MTNTRKWIMEVKVKEGIEYEWKAVRPTGGTRYEYDTQPEAFHMLEMCYPDQMYGEEVRVRQLAEGE